MRFRRTRVAALLTGALTIVSGGAGAAFAADDIADSIAGVIMGDGPEIAGQSPKSTTRPTRKNRRAVHTPAATPIWEQDGPPIDRAGVDGR
jgi:hypothetical protein